MLADVVPQAQQVFAVAPDLRLRPVGAGRAHDQAHALRHVQFGDDVLEPAAIGNRGDLARNAAATRRIGHQDAEPSRERDIGGQRRALRAALLLHDLHQQDLPAPDHLLDLVVAQEARLGAAIACVVTAVVLAAHRLRRRLLGDLIAGRPGVLTVLGNVLARRVLIGRLDDLAGVHLDIGVGGPGVGCRDGRGFIRALRRGRWRFGGRCVFGIGRDALGGDRCRLGAGKIRFHRCGIELRRLQPVRVGDRLSRCLRPFDCRFMPRGVDRRVRRRALGRHRGHVDCRVALQLGRAVFCLLLAARILRLHLDQALPVGDGDLVVVGMDLVEREEAVAVAAVFDERGLQARLYPDHLGEVDVALELFLGGCLDVEIF